MLVTTRLPVMFLCALFLASLSSCKPPTPPKGSPGHILAVTKAVDDAALDKGDSKDWLNYGLNNSENRFSQLDAIKTDNVKELGLAWSYELGSIRGVESTPIVVDGIMYVTGPWSIVHAIDVRSGRRIWKFDPKVPKHTAQKACCDVVNRGVAVYKGLVFVASLDGRLIAINAVSGDQEWEAVTLDQTKNYTITGAPRVIKGKVIIGNGGAEYGVRGFITAYDAETGEQAWRFYSVPGDPANPPENEAMEMAAKTWDPAGEYWKVGGGGTMWDAMAYDPELNLMYVGVGNGSPWNRRLRSPGGGDNLFLSSIVALNPDDGKYAWHYQTTPGDHWDYTATQHLILADLNIEGKERKVIMQAPKNGFYFVIDRTDGSYISAKNFVPVNWAEGYDEKGRPIEISEALYESGAYEAIPGPFGAHNWQPMAFNPQTGLTYIPAQTVPFVVESNDAWTPNSTEDLGPHNLIGWNTGVLASFVPPKTLPFGQLLAWDPVKQEAAWKVDLKTPWNGGVLTTAGNLVFQGTADGRFVAYHAETGEKLWETPTGTGVIAAPATYEVDGEQYVTVAAGWGGVYGLPNSHSETQTSGKVYTFKLGATGQMPEFTPVPQKPLVSGIPYDPADFNMGAKLFVNGCAFCHGVPAAVTGGSIPNLGYSDKSVIENLDEYVLTNALAEKGMPNFKGKLSSDDLTKIQAFILAMADQVRAAMAAAEKEAE